MMRSTRPFRQIRQFADRIERFGLAHLNSLSEIRGIRASANARVAAATDPSAVIKLRLLETSDIHTAVLDWDYYRGAQDISQGLVRTATLIRTARASARNSMLFDNGDLIQGNPLGDFIARPGGLADNEVHPLVACLNLLRTDAGTLGNHEFNFGLPFLERSLKGAAFPIVCANIERADGTQFTPPTVILERAFVDESGQTHTLKIGVIGFVPPQIMDWDKSHLQGRIKVADIIDTATKYVPELRKQCDLVIALSHAGMNGGTRQPNEENASLHLAGVGGIDVIFTGHSHRVFPGPDYANLQGGDIEHGTLAGVPAVMPGFWGSHLGVVDLVLARDGNRWGVASFKAEAQPIAKRVDGKLVSTVAPDAEIAALIAPAHAATRQWVDTPVGTFAEPVNSYFVWTGHDPAGAIVHQAQLDYARNLLVGTEFEHLPLLSAVAPFKVGYTPDWFIDIPAGPVALRSVADLYSFANTLVVVRATGKVVEDWIEHGARIFATIPEGVTGPVDLLQPFVPSYNFDVLAGVTYELDLSSPPKTDADGHIQSDSPGRVRNLKFKGQPIDPEQYFMVVTNNYRADGGGKFPGLGGELPTVRSPDLNRDVVLSWVKSKPAATPPAIRPWHFQKRTTPVVVTFESGARASAQALGDLQLQETDGARQGYKKFRFQIS